MQQDLTLNVQTPCHQAPLRLVAHAHINRERYERTCRQCGFEWTIERRLMSNSNGYRLDALDWTSAVWQYSGRVVS